MCVLVLRGRGEKEEGESTRLWLSTGVAYDRLRSRVVCRGTHAAEGSAAV